MHQALGLDPIGNVVHREVQTLPPDQRLVQPSAIISYAGGLAILVKRAALTMSRNRVWQFRVGSRRCPDQIVSPG